MLFKQVVQNLEECVTRFSEHFKSIYRLVVHYLNSPEPYRNYKRCEELLLGHYRTTVGNIVNGLFYERKTNNLFNGIWRIPSSEIDRPGSFSAQLGKCVSILIQVLMKNDNYKLLLDIGLQLYKTPDNDKRYIKDSERVELYQQCMDFCTRILQNILRQYATKRNDEDILSLLLDCYRLHKKCQKHMNQKDPQLAQVMIDVYKVYIQDKVEVVPEHINLFDLAIKLSLQEITLRKNIEKAGADIAQVTANVTLTRKNNIPGLLMRRGRAVSNAINMTAANSLAGPLWDSQPQTNLGKVNMPTTTTALPFATDTVEFQLLCEEYYKQICKSGKINPAPMLSYPQALLALSRAPMVDSVATTTSAATTTNINESNMNLLQRLPSTLDVAALTKDQLAKVTTHNVALPVPTSDVGVTITPVHNNICKLDVPVTNLASSIEEHQSKIKRASNKARKSPFQRPNAVDMLKTSVGFAQNTLHLEQLNYLEMLANNMSRSELNLSTNNARTSTIHNERSINNSPYNLSTSSMYNKPILPVTSILAASSQPAAQSPTKTLQQKLAERQKANALNDMQPNTVDKKPTIDIIYID